MQKQYQPLALKYRPRKFADLVGQNVLVETLSSAIIHNKIATSYLLTGIRGIGKTTSARIIASIVNCENPQKPQKSGNKVEACGECSNCKSNQAGNHPDIIEIDAASKTSVDDVRTIIDSSEYKAFLGKYKIFIIDEVHMLSKSAFNALLKTLEEPPANVMFIFATTEVNKIPVTILSRCQRFDLRRFSNEEIIGLLTKIADNESIKYDNDAIELIAVKSEGSARDAISMLDQASLLSSTQSEGSVTLKLTLKMLSITSLNIVIDFIEQILNQDANKALEIIAKIRETSGDILYFTENILDVIGYLCKLSATENYEEKLYSSYNEKLKALAGKFDIGVFTMIWQIFTKSIPDIKTSHNQILSLEVTMLKAIYACRLPSIKQIAENIGNAKPASITEPSTSKSESKAEKKEVTIFSLLDHLIQTNEKDIYYYLMNEVKVYSFENAELKLSKENAKKDYNQRLTTIIYNLTGLDAKVLAEEASSESGHNSQILKKDILESFKNSKEWKDFESKVSGAKITDIIHKEWV